MHLALIALVIHTVANMKAALSHVRDWTKNRAVKPAMASGVRHSTTKRAIRPARITVSAGCHCSNSVRARDIEISVVKAGRIHSRWADSCHATGNAAAAAAPPEAADWE